MLTQEQKTMVENSIWVVNTVLKELKLEYDKDLRQQGLLYLCKCSQRFNPDFGVKWTTYAYKSVYLYLNRKNAKEKQQQKKCVSSQVLYSLASKDNVEEQCLTISSLKHVMDLLKPQEQKVLQLLIKGTSKKEIVKMLHIAPPTLNKIITKIKYYLV